MPVTGGARGVLPLRVLPVAIGDGPFLARWFAVALVSPPCAVVLHDAPPGGQCQAAGEGAGERAEGLHVVRARDEQLVMALADRLGREAHYAAVAEAHGAEVLVDDDRADLARLAVHPQRALAAGRRVVDAGDEVPADR